MSTSKTFRTAAIVCLSLVLSACISIQGHLQIKKEDDFFLSIKAPSKQIKNQIRFNAEKTALAYLPEQTRIKLVVKDSDGKHRLIAERFDESIVYTYKLNGRKRAFEPEGQQWFASQVPQLIDKTGLKIGP